LLLSASQLGTWSDCALRGKFHYIDKLPQQQSGAASYGTVMHYVIEQIDRGLGYAEAKLLFERLWREPERLGVKPDYFPTRTSYDSYRRKGLATIDGYQEMRMWGKPRIIAHEYPFLVPIGDHEIRGVIDRLELRSVGSADVLCITDLKTAARKPTKFDLRTNIQFTTYFYATLQKQFWTGIKDSPKYLGFRDGEELFEHFKDVRRVGVYLMLGESCSELDVGDRGDMDFEHLYRLISEVDHAVQQQVFIPRIGSDTCGNCDYFDHCCITIPKPQLDTQLDEEHPRAV
jgi:hypothetical protein